MTVINLRNSDAAASLYPRNQDFRRLMREIAMKGAELARRVDVHPNTVSCWATDRSEVPGAVLAYLELLAKVRALDA